MRLSTLTVLCACVLGTTAGAAELELDGSVLSNGRQTITIGETGLPAQLAIAPTAAEVPLPHRGAEEVDPQMLDWIGRGDRLDQPVAVVVNVEGRETVATATTPATPSVEGGAVVATSTLTAGEVRMELRVRYQADGSIRCQLTPQNGSAERIDLLVDPAVDIDTVVDAGAFAAVPVAAERFAIGDEPGVVWSSIERGVDGVPTHIYVGNGETGFALGTDGSNWVEGSEVPVHSIERDDAGNTSWRVALVGSPGELGSAPIVWTLTAYPVLSSDVDRRQQAWLSWPGDGVDAAQAAVSGASLRTLGVGSGGAMPAADTDLIAAYPLPAFRYLAGRYADANARIVPNSAEYRTAGGDLRPDRAVLGRALLHDIGVDASGLAHLAEARGVVEALYQAGVLATDGDTEFIPYWRSDRYLRYGQVFSAESGFELTEEDPNAGVRVAIYRRPLSPELREQAGNPKRLKNAMQVLLVIVNEGHEPVEDILYIRDADALFGRGGNQASVKVARRELGGEEFLPVLADWHRIVDEAPVSRRGNKVRTLRDLFDGGTVRQVREKGTERQLYGPIHVPARGYRLLLGHASN